MTWVLGSALAAGITGDGRVAVVALIFLGRMAYRREISRGEGVLVVLTAALFFAYGCASISAAKKDIARVLERASRSEGPVELQGWVCGFPYWRYGGVAFDFRTKVGGAGRTVLVQSKEFSVGYGDSLRVRGTWKPLGAYTVERWSTRCLALGVSGEFRAGAGEVERLEGRGGRWITRRVFYRCHDEIRRGLCRGLGSRSGIPIAVLIGERGYLDRKANDAFQALGVTHLIALSGMHLVYVAAVIVLLLRLFGRRSEIVVLAALGLYVFVVGPIVSLYRSFVMAVVLTVASLVKRPLSPVTALVHAFVVVLLLYPHSFYSVAFQLSFIATFAVLLCVRSMSAPGTRTVTDRVKFWVQSSLEVSLAAQLLVTPLIIHYFGRVSLVAPLATLVFLWPVAFLLMFSGLAAVVAVALPWANPVVMAGLDRVTTLFQTTLVTIAEAVPGVVSLPAPNSWLYYGGLCLFIPARGRRGLRAAGTLVVVLSFVAGTGG